MTGSVAATGGRARRAAGRRPAAGAVTGGEAVQEVDQIASSGVVISGLPRAWPSSAGMGCSANWSRNRERIRRGPRVPVLVSIDVVAGNAGALTVPGSAVQRTGTNATRSLGCRVRLDAVQDVVPLGSRSVSRTRPAWFVCTTLPDLRSAQPQLNRLLLGPPCAAPFGTSRRDAGGHDGETVISGRVVSHPEEKSLSRCNVSRTIRR